ncbi:hypothetical protein EMIT053CA3_250009 [Pseudomonas donghuensis]
MQCVYAIETVNWTACNDNDSEKPLTATPPGLYGPDFDLVTRYYWGRTQQLARFPG